MKKENRGMEEFSRNLISRNLNRLKNKAKEDCHSFEKSVTLFDSTNLKSSLKNIRKSMGRYRIFVIRLVANFRVSRSHATMKREREGTDGNVRLGRKKT